MEVEAEAVVVVEAEAEVEVVVVGDVEVVKEVEVLSHASPSATKGKRVEINFNSNLGNASVCPSVRVFFTNTDDIIVCKI